MHIRTSFFNQFFFVVCLMKRKDLPSLTSHTTLRLAHPSFIFVVSLLQTLPTRACTTRHSYVLHIYFLVSRSCRVAPFHHGPFLFPIFGTNIISFHVYFFFGLGGSSLFFEFQVWFPYIFTSVVQIKDFVPHSFMKIHPSIHQEPVHHGKRTKHQLGLEKLPWGMNLSYTRVNLRCDDPPGFWSSCTNNKHHVRSAQWNTSWVTWPKDFLG
jgi:hypothetical protein